MLNPIPVWLLLAVASPVIADQATPTPRPNARFGVQRPSQGPYQKLFEPQKAVQPSIEPQAPGPRRQVVCGLTVITPDPKIDSKMAIVRPAAGIDYKIRAIDPPICKPAR